MLLLVHFWINQVLKIATYPEKLTVSYFWVEGFELFWFIFYAGDVFYPDLNKISAIGWQIPAVLIHDNRFLLVEGLN